jgi:menaquinone-dependent protoporphyrinogen oxidase
MKVLVTAATRHGSTEEIAALIARVLRLRGLDTAELRPADVEDVSNYDAVVLGSAVYAGHWLAPATSLVSRFQRQLVDRPVWLFSSGPVGSPLTPAQALDASDVITATGAIEHRLFAGKLDKSELGRLERAMVRMVRAPEGDYRDFGEVSHWAADIADALSGANQNGKPRPV